VSQESFDLWLGQFAAIRIYVGNIYDLVAGVVVGWDVVITHLEGIERNTRDTVTELRDVNRRLKRMEDNGVKAL
jgi:hypothetical protein